MRLVVDDFGTGYSSLAYLKRLPIHKLKIDRAFVSDLGRDVGDAAIVAGVVAIAAGLKLEVTAEGVETAEQLARLAELRCRFAQGYHIGVQMEADAFLRWLVENSPDGQFVVPAKPAPECLNRGAGTQ